MRARRASGIAIASLRTAPSTVGENCTLALDADGGDIIAHAMTGQKASDASQVSPLPDQIDTPIGQFTADGAYDGGSTYGAVTRHSPDAAVVIPPRANAVERKGHRPLH